jgi:hypothetical protein
MSAPERWFLVFKGLTTKAESGKVKFRRSLGTNPEAGHCSGAPHLERSQPAVFHPAE